MKKLVGIFLVFSVAAFGLNFFGHQSLNGLQRTALFTAPATGAYFIQGNLTLPQLTSTSVSASQAVASVYKNGSSVYTGVAGANGFAITALALVPADAITVGISSNAGVDQGINAVRGDVFFGNAF